VLPQTQDNEQVIECVAALDIGKAELVCCLRVLDEDHRGKRLQEVSTYATMTRSLLGMSDRLACLGVTRVVMEATNGLLRQYLPKGTDLSLHSAAGLARIAASLNGRPRKTLGYRTPSEKLAELLARTG
jgi:hypothetical protein